VFGDKPVINRLNELVDENANSSLWLLSLDRRIQKPRAIIAAPPLLVIFPLRLTVSLVVVPLDTVNVGTCTDLTNTLEKS